MTTPVLRRPAPFCVSCPLPRTAWPTDHRLYMPGGSTCPTCVADDIRADHTHTRRTDI